jgi:threonine/homoserine/homoserine lactone efflux protein
MPFDLWLTFAAASMALLLIPGPTVLLILSYALSKGRSVAVAADRLRHVIARPSIITWITRAGGTALVAMGILTATLRRSTT